jgi:MHS family proline/betaine transporter-like MFS transporter
VLSHLMLWLVLNGASLWTVVLIQSIFAALCGVFLGAMTAVLVEMFPTIRRRTRLTTAYNLQSLVFSGFAPFIASWLITRTEAPISVAYFIIVTAIISSVAVWQLRETAHEHLR